MSREEWEAKTPEEINAEFKDLQRVSKEIMGLLAHKPVPLCAFYLLIKFYLPFQNKQVEVLKKYLEK